MSTYTYSIFDANPNESGSCAWPSHTDVEIEADSDREACEQAAEAAEIEASGLSPSAGYDVGQLLHVLVWDESGMVVGTPTYELTADDLA